MQTGFSLNTDSTDGQQYWATFENHPFAAGTCRYAYRGVLHGNGLRDRTQCVAKVFKENYVTQTRHWIPDVAVSKKAKGFADEFMRYIGNDSIEFVLPLIAKMETVAVYIINVLDVLRDLYATFKYKNITNQFHNCYKCIL